MFRYWQNENFEVTTMFGEGEDVAVFGTFTYRSNTLGKVVTSPFSIHVKVVDGKVTYLQFLEAPTPPLPASEARAPGPCTQTRPVRRSRFDTGIETVTTDLRPYLSSRRSRSRRSSGSG